MVCHGGPGMNKREKILVFASVAAAIWGAIMTLDRAANKVPVSVAEEDVNSFVVKVTDRIKGGSGDSLKGYDLSAVLGERYASPFLGKRLSSKKTTTDLVYNGYVQSGRRIFALINKTEYRVGDIIEGTYMQVKNIDPYRVVLVEGKKKKRILPLEGGGK